MIYKVPDIEKAKAWYSRALGIEPYFDQSFYVGFSVGGYELGLSPDTSGGSSGPGGTTAYWGVADIEAASNQLQSVGATSRAAIEDVGDGILVAVFGDPFDNELGVIQNPHFKTE